MTDIWPGDWVRHHSKPDELLTVLRLIEDRALCLYWNAYGNAEEVELLVSELRLVLRGEC